MQQKAEVLELKQTPQEHDSPNAKWLADKEKQLNNLDKEEHEVVAEKMWQRGKVFFEIRKRYRYREGFVRWAENFGRNRKGYSLPNIYNHINIFIACPTKEHVKILPLWLCRMIGSKNFPKEVRTYIQDNAERLRKDISERELRELADKVKMIAFDPDDPELKKLFKEREKQARQYEYRRKVDMDLDDIENKWRVFDSAARAGLRPDDDGKVRLTEEQSRRPIVAKLKELGYRIEYKRFEEEDVSND